MGRGISSHPVHLNPTTDPTAGETPSKNQPEPPQIKHKTLSAYYPSIVTLRSALHAYPAEALERPTDPLEYTTLLEGCLVASRGGPVDIGTGGIREAEGSQQEAIDRVLQEVSRRDNWRNVLLFGLKASYTHAELPINTSRPAFENRHANSPSAALRSLAWKILRSRIGDAAFRNLLVLHSLFLPVGNNCYAQLSGVPLYDLYDNPYGREALSAPSSVQSNRKREAEAVCGRQCRKRQKRAGTSASSRSVDDISADTEKAETRAVRAADRIILRGKMFYGQVKRDKRGKLYPGLPAHHTLNKLQPKSGYPASDTACLHLLQQIFPSMFSLSNTATPASGGVSVQGSRARLPAMTGMVRELFARHAEIDYHTLVRRCRERKGREKGEDAGLEAISQNSVGRLVSCVGKEIFAVSVVGSEHNREVLMRHMRQFIEMRQHEVVDLHALMQDLRIDDFPWMAMSSSGQRSTASEAKKRRSLVEDFVSWIFAEWLMPLLKNTFYITETAATRYETVYYLQEDWERETKPHLRKLEAQLLEELTPTEAHCAKRGPLGVSAVRLVPKPSGFRPIINLGKRLDAKAMAALPAFTTTKTTTANQILRGLHQILTCEKERHKDQMGCTLFGTNEVFAPLQTLKSELLDRYGSLPRLFFVKMDIKSAFDTIKQDKILEIVEDMLDKDNDYCLMMYSLLLPPASKASQASSRRLWKHQAMPNDGQSTAFTQHAIAFAKPLRNAVLVDLMRRRHVTKEECMELLRIHIQNNVWEVEGKLFRQKTGIPQGSKISSLLCSFFYAVLEREHLGFATTTCSRLLRYIDDFLFITDDLALARRFVQRMQLGFPAFGAFISPGKTLLSFEYASGSQVAPICVGSDGKSYFPYCGFLIDTVTLDISMDYLRVMDTHVKQSFALRSHRRKPSAFVGWFSRQLENRNHVAYVSRTALHIAAVNKLIPQLDSQHNDAHTVRMNVFLNFALTCMKVPHYFAVKPGKRLSAGQVKAITESLCAAAEYTYMAGRARVQFASRADPTTHHYAIKKQDVMHIAQMAMIRVLLKKASQFKLVVHALSKRMTADRRVGQRMADDVLDDVVSEGWDAVKNIKY